MDDAVFFLSNEWHFSGSPDTVSRHCVRLETTMLSFFLSSKVSLEEEKKEMPLRRHLHGTIELLVNRRSRRIHSRRWPLYTHFPTPVPCYCALFSSRRLTSSIAMIIIQHCRMMMMILGKKEKKKAKGPSSARLAYIHLFGCFPCKIGGVFNNKKV